MSVYTQDDQQQMHHLQPAKPSMMDYVKKHK